MFIYHCNICNREFKSKRSLTSHINWHDPIYAEKSKEGAKSTHEKISKIIRQQKLDRLEEYSRNKTMCLYCHSPLNYHQRHNKFCNQSCSTKYYIPFRSKSSYNKGVDTRKKNILARPKILKEKPIRYCIICNSVNTTRKGETCSTECKKQYLSNLMKERMANGFNPRKNRGRGKRSYLEISFENWLIENQFYNFETEFHIKRYDINNKFVKNYYIDFYFPDLNLGIELDGTQHKNTIEKDFDRDKYISSLGIEILRISHQEYLNKSKVNLIKQKLKYVKIINK